MTTNTMYIMFGISMLLLIIGFVALLSKKVSYSNRSSVSSREMSFLPSELPLWRTSIPAILLVFLGVSGLAFTTIAKSSAIGSTDVSATIDSANLSLPRPLSIVVHSNDKPKQALIEMTQRLEDILREQFKNRNPILTPNYGRYTLTLEYDTPILTDFTVSGTHKLSAQISLQMKQIQDEGERKKIVIQPIVYVNISRSEPGQDLPWLDENEPILGVFQNEIFESLRLANL